MLEGEHAVAAGERHSMAEAPFAGRSRFESKHGDTDDERDDQRQCPGKQQAGRCSGPDDDEDTHAGQLQHRIQAASRQLGRAPTQSDCRLVEGDPAHCRHRSDNEENGGCRVVSDDPQAGAQERGEGHRGQRQDQDNQARDGHSGAEGDAADRGRERAKLGQQEDRDPETADRSEKERRRGCGGRQTHISRREQMRGDGPVGEAQYRRGSLLAHQEAEGGEESPQFRGLHRRFRGLQRRLRGLPRLFHREFAHFLAPYGSRSRWEPSARNGRRGRARGEGAA